MDLRIRTLSILAPLVASLAFFGCGSSSDDNSAAGGGTGAVGATGGLGGAGTSGAGGTTTGGGGTTATGGQGGSGGGTVATGGKAASGGSVGVGGAGTVSGSLKDKFAAQFPIGVAISGTNLANASDLAIIDAQFNHITPENSMKAGPIHPAEATWNTTDADALAEYARKRGIKLTGHTLVWHRQTAAWMFAGLTAGDPTSVTTLKARIKAHIEYLVNRYADVVDNWDVVNEALSDTVSEGYRKTDSDWYKYFGNEDYIAWAFQCTHDALEAKEAGSSKGKLYYNDYNLDLKATGLATLLDGLKTKGIAIDGVGEQAHWRTDWPSTTSIQGVMDAVVSRGLKFKISELDLSVYNDYPSGSYTPAAESPFTAALDTALSTRYADLFTLFRKNAANITSVTIWGISDERSWLNTLNDGTTKRANYPLLYGADHQPKKALSAILGI